MQISEFLGMILWKITCYENHYLKIYQKKQKDKSLGHAQSKKDTKTTYSHLHRMDFSNVVFVENFVNSQQKKLWDNYSKHLRDHSQIMQLNDLPVPVPVPVSSPSSSSSSYTSQQHHHLLKISSIHSLYAILLVLARLHQSPLIEHLFPWTCQGNQTVSWSLNVLMQKNKNQHKEYKEEGEEDDSDTDCSGDDFNVSKNDNNGKNDDDKKEKLNVKDRVSYLKAISMMLYQTAQRTYNLAQDYESHI